jgi:hypothetical protein
LSSMGCHSALVSGRKASCMPRCLIGKSCNLHCKMSRISSPSSSVSSDQRGSRFVVVYA